MNNWLQIGTRYINLANVTEVRVQDQHRQAYVFFVGGGALQLDADDAEALQNHLKDVAVVTSAVRRSVSAPA